MPLNPNAVLNARRNLTKSLPKIVMNEDDAAEGGCGVVGFACEIPVAGRHLFDSLEQMRNRGNGKGGGVAMVGLNHSHFGTTKEVLEKTFIVAIAYVNEGFREEVENKYIHPVFEVEHIHVMQELSNWEELLSSLEVRPPEVVCYFVNPKSTGLNKMVEERGLGITNVS